MDLHAVKDRLLTTDEVAEYLRKPASWVRNNAESARIPRRRLGNQYRYKLAEIDAWLDGQRDRDGAA